MANGEKGSESSRLRYLVQVGVVVRDLKKTVETFSSTFGIGPWQYFVWPLHRADMKGEYRGESGGFRFAAALIRLGHVELELIQPLEGDSIYREFLKEKGEGLHHIRFDVSDLDEAVQSWMDDGVKVIQSGTGLRPDTRWAYLNTAELPGFGGIIIEVLTKYYEGDEPPPRPKLSQVMPGLADEQTLSPK